jgi:hypothetical protein
MENVLISEFFRTDGNSHHIRHLLLNAINNLQNCKDCQREYTFNLFNVYLNFRTSEAIIENDLDISDSGRAKLDLEAFRKMLDNFQE